MKYSILRQLKNADNCIVCGTENPASMNARFYVLDNDDILCIAHPGKDHESYPGRLHGGLVSSVLDECMARVLQAEDIDATAITLSMTVNFRIPVPTEEKLHAISHLIKRYSNGAFTASAEIRLKNGQIAAEATGKYLLVPPEKLSESGAGNNFVIQEDIPEEIEF